MSQVLGELGKLVNRRPAETITFGAGALGLALAAVLNLPEGNATLALVTILALLPSLVTTLAARGGHDPAGRLELSHGDLSEDAEYVAKRAVRKVLLGDVTWERDVVALKTILEHHPAHVPPLAGDDSGRNPGEAP